MAVAALNSRIYSGIIQCWDPFRRERQTEVRADFQSCRVSLVQPPGEGASYCPDDARQLATAIFKAADAVAPPQQVRPGATCVPVNH